MLSLEEFKARLGPLAERYTDAEIARLRDLTCGFAALVFDLWQANKKRERDDGERSGSADS